MNQDYVKPVKKGYAVKLMISIKMKILIQMMISIKITISIQQMILIENRFLWIAYPFVC